MKKVCVCVCVCVCTHRYTCVCGLCMHPKTLQMSTEVPHLGLQACMCSRATAMDIPMILLRSSQA